MDEPQGDRAQEYRTKPPLSPTILEKWPVIAGFWLVQTVAVYVLVALDFGLPKSWGDISGLLTDMSYTVSCAAFSLVIAVLQAGFVMPVCKPSTKVDPRPSTIRIVISAYSVGMLVALVLGFVCLLAGTDYKIREVAEGLGIYHSWVSLPLALFVAAAVIAVPIAIWMRRKWKNGIPITVSLAIAGFLSAMVFTGLVCLIFGAARLLSPRFEAPKLGDGDWCWVTLAALLAGWLVATPFLFAFSRGKAAESLIARVAARIFIGTVIEVVATIPVDVMLRKRTSCYCDEGTFFTLLICGSVGAVVLGPAIFLLPLGRRRQRLIDGCCPICGYDMGATPKADACPECGVGWKPHPESTITP